MSPRLSHILFPVLAAMLVILQACGSTKHLAEGEMLLEKNSIHTTDKKVNTEGLSAYVRQRPNTKWFSTLKVPLGIYSMAGTDTTKAINRRLKKWGEAPVVLDTAMTLLSCKDLRGVMQNRGWLDAEVFASVESKKEKRAEVHYTIVPHEQYTLKCLHIDIADKRINSLLTKSHIIENELRVGETFTVNSLYDVRNKATNYLNDNGYYYFNKENITFVCDTSRAERTVDVRFLIGLYRRSSRDSLVNHPFYTIRHLTYSPIAGQELKIRRTTLDNANLIEEGDLYSASRLQRTYNKFSRLKAIRSTNIHFTEVPDSNQLDVNIQMARRKPNSIQIQPEGTNTAGDFGAALSIIYENRNIFRGSELFSVEARGAFEAIRGLEGYDNSNYLELGLETKLSIPNFIVPFSSERFQENHDAVTELLIRYNVQNRPEFHRNVLTSSMRYKWSSQNGKIGYTFDLIDLNYVSMPWISATFKRDYLDNETNRNAILRHNYEDLFIMKIGFGVNYSFGNNHLRTSIETAGNLLRLASSIFNFEKDEFGQYKIANVAFAQYVKMDADYTHVFRLDTRNALALHSRLGIAIPYGNSSILPFEKRYFAGGANSVRGWNVRTLGPGRFIGKDGRIDFLNQTGDIKIDLNAELRTDLFWKFQGALFIDAGNIWTIKPYKDQPDGYFKLRSLYDEMAVSYGLGLRLNFDYFVVRLDLGMKAINPAYTTKEEHFPIAKINFKRDYALHFAVGLPF